jgi:hypothetical protein
VPPATLTLRQLDHDSVPGELVATWLMAELHEVFSGLPGAELEVVSEDSLVIAADSPSPLLLHAVLDTMRQSRFAGWQLLASGWPEHG